MIDLGCIAYWSVIHVDWSEGKWHPKSYSGSDVSYDLLKNIMVCCSLCDEMDNCTQSDDVISTCSPLDTFVRHFSSLINVI